MLTFYPEFVFCGVCAVTRLFERVVDVDFVFDIHVMSHLSGMKQLLQISTETFSQNVLGSYHCTFDVFTRNCNISTIKE